MSAAADSAVKVWDVNRRECVTSIDIKDVRVRPTCIFSISSSNSSSASSSGSLIVVSFTDGSMSVFDLESNEPQVPVLSFETNASGNELVSRINSVVVHPTLPVVVSAHEDRQIKFWDLNNGLLIVFNLISTYFNWFFVFSFQENVYMRWSRIWMKLLVWPVILLVFSF